MAIENKRMQQRHGTYSAFLADKGKYIPGEFQVVQSGDPNSGTGKGLYIAMDASECEQLATFENVKQVVDDSAEEIKEEYLADIQKATSDANTAAGKANTAASEATKATQNAINATQDANTAAKACENIAAGINSVVDDSTGIVYRVGINSGLLYLESEE